MRYDGVLSSSWLARGVRSRRSKNSISELPSVNTWQVTDTTVVPNIITGGIGSYESGNVSNSKQWAVKSTNIFGAHQVKYGVQYDDVNYQQLNQRTGPTFTAPDGRQTATGASIQVIPDVDVGQIYRVTRANFNVSRDIPQNYVELLRAGYVASGRPADRQSRPPLRAGEDERARSSRTSTLKNNWAPRIGATYDARRATARRSCMATTASSTRASRSTWRRARCRPTTASPAATTSMRT